MLKWKNAIFSSLGRKYVMGLSGLALVGFVAQHLLINFGLYQPDGTDFNGHVAFLYSFGHLLHAAEWGLAGLFLLHIVTALSLIRKNKMARPQKYAMTRTKGGPSKATVGSRNMAITGLVLLVFLIVHVIQFRFGPNMAEGYTTTIDGQETRDLFRLVVETFQNPIWVIFYCGSVFLLGFHLRHGFWSAFQSLGAAVPRFSKGIYCLAWFIAVAMALGFFFIPIAIYLGLPATLLG